MLRTSLQSSRRVAVCTPKCAPRLVAAPRSVARRSIASLPAVSALPRNTFGANRRYCSDVTTVSTPAMGDSISSGTLVEWNAQVGDYIGMDEIIAAVETDKITVEIRASEGGTLVELCAEEGDAVEVGAPLYKIKEGPPPEGQAAKEAPKEEAAAADAAPAAGAASTPPPAPKKAATPPPPSPPKFSGGERIERRVPMSRMRLRVAERLKDSQNTAAMLTTFQEVDMHNTMEMRNQYKDAFLKKHGIKLGFMSFFVAASSNALQQIPEVNAVMDGTDMVYRDYVDMSIAVAAPNGLVTPVLRNCDQLSFAEIEAGIGEMGQKARDKKLAAADLTGGSFTISNGGVFGSLMGTPIINPPQSAILGMHSIVQRPVVVNGQIEIRPMMYLALTYDHRIIDGREAVTFLRTIKQGVEDPRTLLLDL